MQLAEDLQGNDGLRANVGIKSGRVAHPRGNQYFGHRRRQHPVVLDTLQGLGPIGSDGVASQRMKGIVDHQFLGLVMGSMQCFRTQTPGMS